MVNLKFFHFFLFLIGIAKATGNDVSFKSVEEKFLKLERREFNKYLSTITSSDEEKFSLYESLLDSFTKQERKKKQVNDEFEKSLKIRVAQEMLMLDVHSVKRKSRLEVSEILGNTQMYFAASLMGRVLRFGRPPHNSDGADTFMKVLNSPSKSRIFKGDEAGFFQGDALGADPMKLGRIKFQMMAGGSARDAKKASRLLARLIRSIDKRTSEGFTARGRDGKSTDYSSWEKAMLLWSKVCVVCGIEDFIDDKKLFHGSLSSAGSAIASLEPLSFDLSVDEEYNSFKELFSEETKTEANQWAGKWVIRKASGSSGEGTSFFTNQDVQKFMNRENRKKYEGVVSRYILNPLLVEGRKSELRVYVVVESSRPELKIHIYRKWFLAKLARGQHEKGEGAFLNLRGGEGEAVQTERFIVAAEKQTGSSWSDIWMSVEDAVVKTFAAGLAAAEATLLDGRPLGRCASSFDKADSGGSCLDSSVEEESNVDPKYLAGASVNCEWSAFAVDLILAADTADQGYEGKIHGGLRPFVIEVNAKHMFGRLRKPALDAKTDMYGRDLFQFLQFKAEELYKQRLETEGGFIGTDNGAVSNSEEETEKINFGFKEYHVKRKEIEYIKAQHPEKWLKEAHKYGQEDIGEALYMLAQWLFERGHHKEAGKLAAHVPRDHPKFPSARMYLGLSLSALQRLKEAIAAYQMAMDLDEKFRKDATAKIHRLERILREL
eukprot:g1524.t1